MPTVISVEHLSKAYRLGQIGTPSESTRGERPAPSRADLEAWRAKGITLCHELHELGEGVYKKIESFIANKFVPGV